MRTFETTVFIDESRDVTLRLPAAVEPGAYKIVVVIDEDKTWDQFGTTPEECVKSFQHWMNKMRPSVPQIPLHEFRRENLYE